MQSRARIDASATPRIDELVAHAPYLERLSRALARDEHAARDLVQETWARALTRPPRHGANVRAWLGQVLRRTHWSSARREDAIAESIPEAIASGDPVDELERHDALDVLRGAVAQLESPMRETLRLRYFDDLTPSAIAVRQGVPVSTVHTRLQRGLGTLRARLDRRLGEGRWLALLLALPSRGTAPAERVTRWGTRVAAAAVVIVLGVSTAVVFSESRAASVAPDTADAASTSFDDGPRADEPTTDAHELTTQAVASGDAANAVEGPVDPLPGPVLVVEVRSPDGRPVAGAEVAWFDTSKPTGSTERLGVTGSEGRVSIAADERVRTPSTDPLLGGCVGLIATARGWSASPMRFAKPDAGTLTLTLGPPSRTVRGRVVDSHGAGIANARLEVGGFGTLVERDGILEGTLPLVGHTNEAGAITLEGVPPGTRSLEVHASGFAVATHLVPDAANPWLDVVLERAATLVGTASDASGAPLARARIWIDLPSIGRDPAPAFTDEQGAFTLADLPPGDHWVFARDQSDRAVVDSGRVALKSGATTTWNPRLEHSTGLVVELVDGDGRPTADWLLNVASADLLWLTGASTNAAGRIHLRDLPDGELTVSVIGERTKLASVVVPRYSREGVTVADSPLRITLTDDSAPSATLRGEVVGANGATAAGLQLRLRRPFEPAEGIISVDPDSGRFATPPIPPGTWSLRVESSYHGSVELGEHSLERGAEVDLGRVELPEPGGVSLKWHTRPGDRVVLRQMSGERVLAEFTRFGPPDEPLRLFPCDLRVLALRSGVERTATTRVEPATPCEIDVDALFDRR